MFSDLIDVFWVGNVRIWGVELCVMIPSKGMSNRVLINYEIVFVASLLESTIDYNLYNYTCCM